ncbi:hypothetical protein VNO77_26996 [Canavalia gladiata]|uniref:Uncharacterized protein n=1 Tax=Canavalia gladiata TaxID=3824 RepID=A0AAN9KTZ8_CANGL
MVDTLARHSRPAIDPCTRHSMLIFPLAPTQSPSAVRIHHQASPKPSQIALQLGVVKLQWAAITEAKQAAQPSGLLVPPRVPDPRNGKVCVKRAYFAIISWMWKEKNSV